MDRILTSRLKLHADGRHYYLPEYTELSCCVCGHSTGTHGLSYIEHWIEFGSYSYYFHYPVKSYDGSICKDLFLLNPLAYVSS